MRASIARVTAAAAIALRLCPEGFGFQSAIPPEIYVARATLDAPIQRVGTTKRVAVVLRRAGSELRRTITALEGNQFAVRPLRKDERDTRAAIQDNRGAAVTMVAPVFLPGDTGIEIQIDASVGYTEFAGLKLLDAATLRIALDGVVESDREGVRAVAFEGSVKHADCFLAVSQTADGAFDIGSFMSAPAAADGSMHRKAGESLDCPVSLNGADGQRYRSASRNVGGKMRIVFVRDTGETR